MITNDNVLMTMLNLLLPDTLKELQHRQCRVGGAIIRPARELEMSLINKKLMYYF